MESVIAAWQPLMTGVANEEGLVNNTSDGGADERPGPENPMVGPVEAGQSRPKRHGRVHGSAGEGATGENISRYNETNCDGSNSPQLALIGINGRGVHSVNQSESHNDLKHKAGPHRNSRRHCERRRFLRLLIIT